MRHKFDQITFDALKESISKKKQQAQLRQIVHTIYPSAQSGNDMNGAFVPESEFGDGQEYKETRVAWVDIPLGYTEKQVLEQLEKFNSNGAVLYKVLSLKPILTSSQIAYGLNEKDVAQAQLVLDNEGKPALYNGHEQYRRIFFSAEPKADIDNRHADLQMMRSEISDNNDEIVAAKEVTKEVVQ